MTCNESVGKCVVAITTGLSALIDQQLRTRYSIMSYPGCDADGSEDKIRRCEENIRKLRDIRQQFEDVSGGL